MSEKRRSKRYPKRLRVRFGEKGKGFTHVGITGDVSSSGMFVGTTAVIEPGTRVHLELTTADNDFFYFEGIAARQVQVPPELRQLMKAGFGMRFLLPGDVVGEVLPASREAKPAGLVLSYESPAAFAAAWERELKRGGAFCWAERGHVPNAVVPIEVQLAYNGTRQVFEGRVVHVLPEQNGRYGVAFMFVDQSKALASLNALLQVK